MTRQNWAYCTRSLIIFESVHMQKMRGFTLIEIILVIILMGIILLITLNISNTQATKLRFRIAKETFVANYNNFIIKALTNSITNDNDRPILHFQNGTGNSMRVDNLNIQLDEAKQLQLISNNGIPVTTAAGSVRYDTNTNGCVYSDGTSIITGSKIPLVLQDASSGLTGSVCINLLTCKIFDGGC